jgi:hypothetical protein
VTDPGVLRLASYAARRLGAFVRWHPVPCFFALAYARSWSWSFALVARGDVLRAGAGWPTHLPALLGPAVAAFVVTAEDGSVARRVEPR